MSLLQSQTSSLLGIGEGSIQDFAAGIRSRRKESKGVSREEALARATANEGQDERLRQSGDLTPVHDPKLTQGAQLKLNMDDKAFIQKVQNFDKILSVAEKTGKSDTAMFRAEYKDLLSLAHNSSRGGLADLWSEPYTMLEEPGMTGKELNTGEWQTLKGAFMKAKVATDKVLDTSIDINTYKFEGGRTEKLKLGMKDRKYARDVYQSGKQAQVTNFWENPNYVAGAVKPPAPLTIEQKRAQKRTRLSIRR